MLGIYSRKKAVSSEDYSRVLALMDSDFAGVVGDLEKGGRDWLFSQATPSLSARITQLASTPTFPHAGPLGRNDQHCESEILR
jgi:hypothetical protein